MSEIRLSPRALLHLCWNGARAVDVVSASLETGLLDALAAGPASLGALAARLHAAPLRLYKLLDCLESMGLVAREQRTDALGDATYTAIEGLREAASIVLGPGSLERDREKFDWRAIHGRLPEVLRGEASMPRASFDWPPRTPEQVASFEASMVAGLGPIREVFGAHGSRLFPKGTRLLDVGGGDGTLAADLLASHPAMTADVYNLPATRPLVERTRADRGLEGRLGFVAGDFLREALPQGYDAISFVRVLHDWPMETARALLRSAHAALPPGGRVIICEELRTPERLAAQFFWSYFLVGVDNCVSRLREVEIYLEALVEMGFEKPEVLAGPFEVIVAQKR